MEPMKIRDRGVQIGRLPTGRKNCITDIPGVMVGHVTLDFPLPNDEYACTGVTAILPHGDNLFTNKVIAAGHVLNGFGKTTGLVQVDELGVIEAPIMLTNTFAISAVTQGTLRYMLEQNSDIGDTTGTINLVVGECNDSHLNSIRLLPVEPKHAIEAIENASTNICEEGAVGAGKGMVCFGHKGGVGSSSRIIKDEESGTSFTMGCVIVSNFGKKEEFFDFRYQVNKDDNTPTVKNPADVSIMMVIATDAPLSNRQLKRVAKRCGVGLGRTGSHYSNGSGDIVIAFSTAHKIAHTASDMVENRQELRDDHPIMNIIFQAATEVIEEAILNSLSQAVLTKGRKGQVVYPYPFE